MTLLHQYLNHKIFCTFVNLNVFEKQLPLLEGDGTAGGPQTTAGRRMWTVSSTTIPLTGTHTHTHTPIKHTHARANTQIESAHNYKLTPNVHPYKQRRTHTDSERRFSDRAHTHTHTHTHTIYISFSDAWTISQCVILHPMCVKKKNICMCVCVGTLAEFQGPHSVYYLRHLSPCWGPPIGHDWPPILSMIFLVNIICVWNCK